MPDITIITAAHLDTVDKVRWLRECAESVLRQDFGEWEWVVVDDFSPTAPDLPSDVRVRAVRAASRCGPAACRNTGVALARSPCVLALDADDLLAGADTLGKLYRAWSEHTDRFVYGDLQLLEDGKPGKVVQFPEYDFQKSLDPKGIVPVTAAHSVECWHKAGGWKPGLVEGLEDVEYWISAGAAGFCGLRLDHVALVYRRHPQSRTARMRAALKEREMRQAIRAMHSELYEGRIPMGCCGGKQRTTKNVLPEANVAQPVHRLAGGPDEYPGGKIWVQYNGGAQGEFEVRGQVTRLRYVIPPSGGKFEVWVQDASFFSRLGRGKDFTVGVSPPAAAPPPPRPEPVGEEPGYEAPEPVLATIERLDAVGAATRGEPVPREGEESLAAVEAEPPRAEMVSPQEYEEAADDLLAGMASLTDAQKRMLELEGWTLPKLAGAEVEELVPYPGIGKVTAARAIAEANRLWAGE